MWHIICTIFCVVMYVWATSFCWGGKPHNRHAVKKRTKIMQMLSNAAFAPAMKLTCFFDISKPLSCPIIPGNLAMKFENSALLFSLSLSLSASLAVVWLFLQKLPSQDRPKCILKAENVWFGLICQSHSVPSSPPSSFFHKKKERNPYVRWNG